MGGEKKSGFAAFMAKRGFFVILAVFAVIISISAMSAARNSVKPPEFDGFDIESNFDASDVLTPQDDVVDKKEDPPVESKPETDEKPSPEGDDVSVETEVKVENVTDSDLPMKFSFPLVGDIMWEYSGDELVYSETMEDYRQHTGIDIAAEAGTEVKAIEKGVISGIYYDDMWGQVIVISHPGEYKSYYKCLAADMPSDIKPNSQVKKGQLLGKVGENLIESALPPHLHLEMQAAGKYIDALNELEK